MIDHVDRDDRSSESNTERATAWLRREIVTGRLPPNQKLSQRHLARELGVSFIPLREALRTLEAEGFLTARYHGTTLVAPMNQQELQGIVDLQFVLIPALIVDAQAVVNARRLNRISARLAECVDPEQDAEDCFEQRHVILAALTAADRSPSQKHLVSVLSRNLERYLRADGNHHLELDCSAYSRLLGDLIAECRTGRSDRIAFATRRLLRHGASTAARRAQRWL